MKIDAKLRERITKAQDIALERMDYILETTPDADFIEVIGCVGGDTMTLRIYDDGGVYAK